MATSTPQRSRQVLGSLGAAGYEVHVVAAADQVLAGRVDCPVAVVFDVTGVDERVVVALHHDLASRRVPLIAFTASPDRGDGIGALEAGAEELLTTTMSSEELIARVRAVIRRRSGGEAPPASVVLTGGPVVVDSGRRRVEVSGRAVFLTALEFKLLSYFLMHPDQAITRDRLLEAVWGYSIGGTATVTVHVRRLREKIEEDPANPLLIRTVWGVGYRFAVTGP